jgi:hypothetical protein
MATFVERMIGAAKMEPATYEEVEADRSATPQALGVVLLSSLAAAVGSANFGMRAVIGTFLAAIIGWAVFAGLVYLIGTKLLPEPQTRSDWGELLRTVGFAASPGVLRFLGIIPVLGWILNFVIWLWMLATTIVAARQALDYHSTGRAAGVCFLAWLVALMVNIALGVLFGVRAAVFG